jgi:hypothetical protein
VIFVSRQYAEKKWTTHERRSAIERALDEHQREYILPIQVDDTQLPGIHRTLGYVPISKGIRTSCALLLAKLSTEGAVD